jgi:hypothetical protein
MTSAAILLVATATATAIPATLPATLPECQVELVATYRDAVTWEARARSTLLDLDACTAARQALQEVIQAPGTGPLAWDPGEDAHRSLEPPSPLWRDVGLLLLGVVAGGTVTGVVLGVLASTP